MGKRKRGLESDFEAVARLFSKNSGLRVEVHEGNEALYDFLKNVIRLPAFASYLEGADARAVEGILDHEAAHADEERKLREAGRSSKQVLHGCSKQEHLMINAVEDCRIERDRAARYPGMKRNLAELHKAVAAHVPFEEGHPLWKIGVSVFCAARGFEIPGSEEWQRGILANFGDIIEEMRDPERLASMDDSVRIGRKILARVKDLSEEEPEPEPTPKPDSGKGEEGESGEEGSKSEQGEGEGESESKNHESGESGEGNPLSDEDGEGEGSERTDSPETGSDDDTGRASERGVREACKAAAFATRAPADLLDPLMKALRKRAEDRIASEEVWTVHPRSQVFVEKPYFGDSTSVAEARKKSSVFARRLRSLLNAKAQNRRLPDQESGRLDSSNLYGVRTGNLRVFERTRKGEAINTAITILVDHSGSMAGKSTLDAQEACAFISAALDKIGVPFEVIGFSAYFKNGYIDESGYGLLEDLVHTVYKGFDEPLRKVEGSFHFQAGANNADGDSLLWAAKRIAKRKEDRKIIVVISDGDPAHYSYQDPEGRLRDVVSLLAENGIDTVGVGVGRDGKAAVERFYEYTASCLNSTDLSKTLIQVFERILMDRSYGKRRKAS